MADRFLGFELLGMPNSGKSELGYWLNGRIIGGVCLRYLGNRRSPPDNDSDRTSFHLDSLEMMREYFIASNKNGEVLIVDRGFHDKLLLYTLLLHWGLVNEQVIARCREIMSELCWHQVPKILFLVTTETSIIREPKAAGNPYARWSTLVGEPVADRMEHLCSTYRSIEADQTTCIIDGTADRENSYQRALEFIKRHL